jgi:hypothetical protein
VAAARQHRPHGDEVDRGVHAPPPELLHDAYNRKPAKLLHQVIPGQGEAGVPLT